MVLGMVHKDQSSTFSTDRANKAEKLFMKSSNLYLRHNPWVIFLGFLLLPYYSQSVFVFCAPQENPDSGLWALLPNSPQGSLEQH